MRYEVHVYKTNGCKIYKYRREDDALAFAREEFKKSDVYKIKVWDTSLGKIEPNNPNAEALIAHFI